MATSKDPVVTSIEWVKNDVALFASIGAVSA
jgi:hypothetical protein